MGSKHTPHHRRAPRRGPVTLILAAALAVTACGGDGDDAATADVAEATAEDTGGATEGGAGGDFLATDESGGAVAADRPAQGDGGFDIGVIGRDVIVEMRVVLSSDDIERTVASIMASSSTLGGGVASSDVNYGNANTGGTSSQGYAVLVVKVPPESVDRLLSGLDDTGTVQSINQSAQDVTEQLVNLDVRIRNARQSVDNVREFMDRTENLNELVTLEAELTRRQTELEQLEAQQRNIADRVALSTITIEVIPTADVPEPIVDDDQSIGDAFRSGWDAFVAVLFGLGFVLAATLPFLVSGLLLVLAAWTIVRRRDARRPDRSSAPLPAPSAPHDPTADSERDRDREPEPVG
jgi:hypothetical protein